MPVEIQCPGCGRRYVLTDKLLGKRVKCVECGSSIEVAVRLELEPEAASADSSHREPTHGPRRILLMLALVACAVILTLTIAAAFALPALRRTYHEMLAERCRSNLEHIAAASFSYSLRSDDQFPFDERGELYSLALLYPDHLDNPAVFTCPAPAGLDKFERPFPPDSSLAGHLCSYRYQYQRTRDSDRAAAMILSDVPGRHHALTAPGASKKDRDGNAIFADLRVVWVENLESK